MTQAVRDENRIPSILGVLNTDGATPTMVEANPTNHGIEISDGTTGTVTASEQARRDQNVVTTMLAVSNSDGTTRVQLAVNSSGQLLVQST